MKSGIYEKVKQEISKMVIDLILQNKVESIWKDLDFGYPMPTNTEEIYSAIFDKAKEVNYAVMEGNVLKVSLDRARKHFVQLEATEESFDPTKMPVIGTIKTKPINLSDGTSLESSTYDVVNIGELENGKKIYFANRWYKPGVPQIVSEDMVETFTKKVAESFANEDPRVSKAFELGKEAFHKGILAAPAQDPDFMPLMKDLKVMDPVSMKILKAWSAGWHSQNLED